MRNHRVFGVAAAAFLLAFVAEAQAKPLDLKHVAADSKWLGHVDFDAMRDSFVVQKAMEKHHMAAWGLAIAQNATGMKSREDLHGLTFYGKEIGKHTGVMILHAKMDHRRLTGMAERLRKHQVAHHGPHKLHSWVHRSRHGSRTVAAAFYGEDHIVFASSVDELRAAMDVLQGKSKSVHNHAALAGRIPPGTTMLMRVEGVSQAEKLGKHPLAKQTQSFRFVTGEYEGKSFCRARAKMTNTGVAAHLKAIIEGARALGLLHVGADKKGKNMVNDLRVKTEGTTLTVLWSAPAADVWAVIDSHKKKFAAKMAKRCERRGCKKHGMGRKHAPKKEKILPEEDF